MWVWGAGDGGLVALLVHLEPIVAMRWRPGGEGRGGEAILAYCTGSPRLYFWSNERGSGILELTSLAEPETLPTSASVSVSTADFRVTGLQWRGDGAQLLVTGRGADQGLCRVIVLDAVADHISWCVAHGAGEGDVPDLMSAGEGGEAGVDVRSEEETENVRPPQNVA